ncbi:nitroreductase family protein [Allobranchiibius sp. CTAmp26]|uniref:nitroreductase family protein n=1 Tax=Allobranchiibius sp. CTAmp26 TaxID=2815214 RepID=UPI0027DDB9C6|nr:nitroreductase family protein [Allobranchiibius sp. CTAmp26]
MELREAVLRRRMVRRFDATRPVPPEVLRRVAQLALRAPSAGFSQGFDFVVLRDDADRAAYWSATTDPDAPSNGWLHGVSDAPVLILCCSDRSRYLRRYAEPDKARSGVAGSPWPVPYWDVDTGMASMLMLLGAVDEGLGGLFFGVPADRADAVLTRFDIPEGHHLVGVVALGYAAEDRPSGSTRTRARRPLDEVFHDGSFGVPLH